MTTATVLVLAFWLIASTTLTMVLAFRLHRTETQVEDLKECCDYLLKIADRLIRDTERFFDPRKR